MTLPRALTLLLLYCFLLTNVPVIHAAPIVFRSVSQTDDNGNAPAGLKFRLSEVPDQPTASPTPNVAPAQTLSVAETNQILKALPPIIEEPQDEPFRIRERTMPPPRTGKTISVSFPASEQFTPPDVKSPAPLEVVRYAPQGSVEIAPSVSITFSQPMVALNSQEEAALNVPVNVSPRVDGKWRWLSPTTLLFEPHNRLPMATDYTVSVPAGIKSAAGSSLKLSRTWNFSTPAPTIKHSNIVDSVAQRRDKIIFLEFDQRINPTAVLKKIRLSHGDTIFQTRLATTAEIEGDEDVRNFVSVAQKGRWIAFRAINRETGETQLALPSDASIAIQLDPGTSSAEGPKTTTTAQKLAFKTFGPMRVTRHMCGYGGGQICSPGNLMTLVFTNPIDPKQFETRDIRIEPAISNAAFHHYGNVLQISGTEKANTQYAVTINTLRDTFGQNIEKPITVVFQIGPAIPLIHVASDDLVVIDPAGPASVAMFTRGIQKLVLEIYSVQPEDWPKFSRFRKWLAVERRQHSSPEPPPPGKLVLSREVNFTSSDGNIEETTIDLRSALTNKLGHLVIHAKQVVPEAKIESRQQEMVWIQSTRMGLAALTDRQEMIAWASSLNNGAPLSNVKIRLLTSTGEVQTDSNGLARLELPHQTGPLDGLLIARHNNDVAILPETIGTYLSDSLWRQRAKSDSLAWYVFDDRGLYRPGEQVHVKGWVRRITGGKTGDVGPLMGAGQNVDYVLEDARDNEIAKGTLRLNTFGAFDSKISLPATMNLGETTLKLELPGKAFLDGRSAQHVFDVQEFRRPEFEINAKSVTNGPLFIGDHADVVVSANYFAGGPLPDAAVTWNVASDHATFTPPNRDTFTFGRWSSWWDYPTSPDGYSHQSLVGKTNASGTHRVRMNFDSVKPAFASRLSAQATVTDVNRQTWSSSVDLLIHPASVYVGLRSKKMFVQQGEPLVVESIVTDLDGKPVSGTDVSMTATQLEWKQIEGSWQEVAVGSQECTQRSKVEVGRCTFASKGGSYRITATVRDAKGRRSDSEIRLWVAGARNLSANVNSDEIQMIPQAKEYKPGDVAEVLIQAPFYPAEGLMTLGRSGIVKSERFTVDGPTYTLRVPIVEEWTPNIHLKVDLVGIQDRKTSTSDGKSEQKQPAFASGEIDLSIPPVTRRLEVAAVPRETTLQPGGNTTIDLEVKNAEGEPASNSEVAVAVVDEAVLAMTDYKLKDPLTVFYAGRDAEVDDYHSRAYVLLTGLDWREGGGGAGGNARSRLDSITETVEVSASASPINARMLDGATFSALTKSGVDKPKISLRKNFDALAAFAPSVSTDMNGRAQVSVKLPDNLTRYRIMAVAVDGTKRFGMGESAITARNPLMVRPSAPRFLNFGDRFDLPIVIQNQTDQTMSVDVAARASNAAFVSDSEGLRLNAQHSSQPIRSGGPTAGRRVIVPANNRVEVRLPAAVTRTGTARFQVAAVSGNWTDAAEVSLPIWTPATTEAFATYGQIDDGSISQPVKAPANVLVEFGGLEIQTSSTQLHELTDAFLYLQNYPYECSEQIASRIISVAALRDVLSAFKAKDLPSPAEIEAAMARDLKRLEGMQNFDGGFGFWTRNQRSWPFLSLHVAHALARAREKKFNVPDEMLRLSSSTCETSTVTFRRNTTSKHEQL